MYIYVCISYMTESASFSFWRRVVKDSCIQSMRLALKETYIHVYIYLYVHSESGQLTRCLRTMCGGE